MIKVIIAGGRDFDDYERVYNILFTYPTDSIVVSGTARGADALGEKAAAALGLDVMPFPADWDKHGKGAGFIRNNEMAKYADVLIAFWDGESRGTHNMIHTALDHGLEVHVYRY
jgi:hypothetical protein